jgi:hypothetical protein
MGVICFSSRAALIRAAFEEMQNRDCEGQDASSQDDEKHRYLIHGLLDGRHILAYVSIDPQLEQLPTLLKKKYVLEKKKNYH